MKAAVLHAPNQPLTIEDISLTKPQGREVLLRTAFAGLCHSDLHFIEGLYPHPTPCVLGHDSSAVVEAVGDQVTYVKPGDHVITCLSVFCGGCGVRTGGGAVCSAAEVEPGATVAVIGWGGVGRSGVNGAALAGAERSIAIDRVEWKLGIGRELGAAETISASNGDAGGQVRE